MKIFAALDIKLLGREPNAHYRMLTGATYSEETLRKWANEVWGTPLDAPIERVAADIAKGGWGLLEMIQPEE
jgi:hypothetical protein